MTKNELLNLSKKVKDLRKNSDTALPENSFFLDKDEIICYPRENGDSRYPYYNDGLVLFAHSDGYIDCIEGGFNIFKCAHYNEDACVAFFAGEKKGDVFNPISITGAARQLFEENVNRYTVFTPACAYYVAETPKALFAAKVYVDGKKHIRFSVGALNLAEEREIYLCSFFEATLRDTPFEVFFARMSKFGQKTDNGGYIFKNQVGGPHFLTVRRAVTENLKKEYRTSAKNDFIRNRGGNLTNALSLKNGSIENTREKTNTTEIPVLCDLIRFDLKNDDFAQISYEFALTESEEFAFEFANSSLDTELEDKEFNALLASKREEMTCVNINFEDWHNKEINPQVLNNFLECVKRQVSLCALNKNYAGSFLGIRDVFQQLELSLLWQKDESRAQLVRVMNYILEDGRPPRQITICDKKDQIPKMDLRPFIDQGFWIISTFHTYLAYTDDYSILDEECGYFKAQKTYGPLTLSNDRNSVLEHLLRIMKFLISNIDEKTGCIRALFGDWNDALDGLGRTKDTSKEFGSGVSVMATLQLYLSLTQICEILEHIGYDSAVIQEYRMIRDSVAEGIEKYAIVKDADGKARMAHGWGDEMSYYVGSYNDYDGVSRISLTANAFYAISGIVERMPQYKDDIINNILALNTRFGLLTFDKPFTPYASEVGRISTITPGTYENCCTYVHAGTFGALALFFMGKPKEAWESLEKSMVISHKNVTLSTFVMPNSYCIDGEYDYDGESMGDWYTGSGAVLIKNIIKCGFGIEPTLNAVKIMPSAYFPAKKASIQLRIGGNTVKLVYENQGKGKRQILLNGNSLEIQSDKIRAVDYALVKKDMLADNSVITVID